jgi:hypothetical protein
MIGEKKKYLIFEMVEVRKFDKTYNCEALVLMLYFGYLRILLVLSINKLAI